MSSSYFGRFGEMPPVVKNLIVINALLLFIAFLSRSSLGIELNDILGLHYFGSEKFKPFQFVSHMFMHGGIGHLFFNMFALWMFGKILEGVWGSKRFLTYYLITGLGAAVLHTFVNWIEISSIERALSAYVNTPSLDGYILFVKDYFPQYYRGIQYNEIVEFWSSNPNNTHIIDQSIHYLNLALTQTKNIPTVGASGAVFGVLLAFGMLFPNTKLMLLFPPIPIKAKYFVIMYGALELYLGLAQPGSNIAHFAHLGGMLFGFILIKYWRYNKSDFY